jgi:hypothetical protein
MTPLRLILVALLTLTAPTIGQATDITSSGKAAKSQGLALGIAQGNSSRETPTCRAFYKNTKNMDSGSCTHVSIAIAWTSATFELPEQCDTWDKFVASGSKSSSNYGAPLLIPLHHPLSDKILAP